MKQKGFTLIEMLVVVAIIGILSSVILVGLTGTRKQGRDTRRIADLRQVQTGLELYFNKNGAFPDPGNWTSLSTALTGAGLGINTIPKDPLSTQTYYYGVSAARDEYVLGARLEDANNSALTQDIDGTLFSINCTDQIYCIRL